MVLNLQASSGSERFQALCSQAQVAFGASNNPPERGFAPNDEQLHRGASNEHCHVAAVDITTNISLGLGMPPTEALEVCSPKHSSVR